MKAKELYRELYQFFGCYFNQDYDVMVENFDRNKPTIPQLVYGFKEENPPDCIPPVIKELEHLISQQYTSTVLDTLSSELGNDLDVVRLGYTYQQFLIEILRILKEPSPV